MNCSFLWILEVSHIRLRAPRLSGCLGPKLNWVSYKAKILKPPSSSLSLSLLHFQVHTFLSRTFWLFLAKPSIFHWKVGFFVLMLVNFSPYKKLRAIWVKRVCSKLVFEWQSNPTRCWLTNTYSQTLLFHTHLRFWGFSLANWYVRHSL